MVALKHREYLRHKQDAAWKDREDRPAVSEAQQRRDLREFVAWMRAKPWRVDAYVVSQTRQLHTASIGRSNSHE